MSLPAPALAWGLNSRVFYDDFNSLATIDLTDSGAPGFNWYIRNAWQSPSANTIPWYTGPGTPNTDVSQISVAGSKITFNSNVKGEDVMLSTACPVGSGYVGNTFTGTAYYEFSMATDNTLANVSAPVVDPIGWGIDTRWLTNQTNQFVEIDIMEMFALGPASAEPLGALHDWEVTPSSVVYNNNNSNIVLGTSPDTAQHIYGALHIAPADNGGIGLVQWYVDGVHIAANDVTYSPSAPSNGASPSNPNGTFYRLHDAPLVFFIGCGFNWPATLDYFGVWQKPTTISNAFQHTAFQQTFGKVAFQEFSGHDVVTVGGYTPEVEVHSHKLWKKFQTPSVSQSAQHLGRLGGLVGGPARAESLSKRQLSSIGKQGARARWS